MTRKNLPPRSQFSRLVKRGMKRHAKAGGHNGRPMKYAKINDEGKLTLRKDIYDGAAKYATFHELYPPHERKNLILGFFPNDIASDMTAREAKRLARKVEQMDIAVQVNKKLWKGHYEEYLQMPSIGQFICENIPDWSKFVEALPSQRDKNFFSKLMVQ